MSGEEKNGSSEPPAPAPAPAPAANDAFKLMMGSQARKRSAKYHNPPPGPKPKGKKWDPYGNMWVSIEADADAADELEEEAAVSAPARARKVRTFQNGWKEVLPTLICCSILACGAVCTNGDGDEKCPGCADCARLFCTECQNDGSSNAFVSGSTWFHSTQQVVGHHVTVEASQRSGASCRRQRSERSGAAPRAALSSRAESRRGAARWRAARPRARRPPRL